MNFFKSILLDDPDPPKPETPHQTDSNPSLEPHHDDHNTNDVAPDNSAGMWNFGSLIKTIATRSESVIETYRKDLQEFGSGLRKETEIIRETASRAVKDLPTSLEAGASAAHGALDGVLKSTAEIIAKETPFFGSDGEPETPETNQSLNSNRYSWFESQLGMIQSDLTTFCDEPEDVEDYKKWKLGFELQDKIDEIEVLTDENGSLKGVHERLVPDVVDNETFWFRYFYRVYKLGQQENVRANLVKRAISVDDDEELSWDVDDEDEDEDEDAYGNERKSGLEVKGGDVVPDKGVSNESKNPAVKPESSTIGTLDDKENNGDNDGAVEVLSKKNLSVDTKEVKSEEFIQVKNDEKVKSEDIGEVKIDEKVNLEDVAQVKSDEKVKSEDVAQVKNDEKVKSKEMVEEKNDKKVGEENKGELINRSDAEVMLSHHSKPNVEEEENEDLEWDEIKDIGSSGDEKKISVTDESPNRAELRRRLSAEEDDEDLSWDIEDDDDEPLKS